MGQLDLLTSRRMIRGQPHRVRALTVSIVFHGLLIATLILLGYLYHPSLFKVHNGSAPGAMVISLQTMVIVASPEQPVPPAPTAPPLPATTSLPVPTPPLIVGVASPQPVHAIELPTGCRQTVEFLFWPTTLRRPPPPRRRSSGLPRQRSPRPPQPAPGSGTCVPPGQNIPPATRRARAAFRIRPTRPRARDLQQTGVVRMMIHFNTKGDVVRAEIVKSSGVAILDSTTRDFIYANWHSQTFAGQAVSVPVEYTLTSL